jgi:citrate lyase subunit beta / citryl-CoA lyase
MSEAVIRRSYLYIPGDQPQKLARGHERGADALIVDLEDAVAPRQKTTARAVVTAWLEELPATTSLEIWIRVNASGENRLPPEEDLLVVVHPRVRGLIQPKCERPVALEHLDGALTRLETRRGLPHGSVAVVPLIETPRGVVAQRELAAGPRVARLQLGEADLAAALGMRPGPDRAELLSLRVGLVVDSAAAGLEPPVGPVHTQLSDPEGLRRSSEALRRLGYGGRAAIHPAQVALINAAFTPTSQEQEEAARIVAEFDERARSGQAVSVNGDGDFLDEAVVRSARALLGRAHPAGPGEPPRAANVLPESGQ